MSGEGDDRSVPIGQHVVTMRLHFYAFDVSACARRELRQIVGQKHADLLLVRSDGVDIDKCARQLKDVHKTVWIEEAPWQLYMPPARRVKRWFVPLPDSAPLLRPNSCRKNDSGQVLTLPPNRNARTHRSDFGEEAPFTLRSGMSPELRAGLLMAPAPLPEIPG